MSSALTWGFKTQKLSHKQAHTALHMAMTLLIAIPMMASLDSDLTDVGKIPLTTPKMIF